ncbi:putative disease resistance protein RGA3 [Carex rostrata]
MNWLGKITSAPGLAEKVVDKGCSLVESGVTRYWNVEEELGRLRRTSVRINSLLTDAEERRYIEDKSVMDWLSDLKSVSFDTDDLLDEYQTAINVHKVEPSRKRKRNRFELPSISPEWDPFQRSKFASEINKINNRYEEILKNRKNLRLNGEDGERRGFSHQRSRPCQTGPYHDRASMIDRENDKIEVVDLLITGQTITVVPIHGAAGIGKTTLAQKVYHDPRLNCFNIKAWVCLTERCDLSTAMKEIYEKMTRQRCDSGDFGRLQERLGEYLEAREGNNKFLLVIDNLWATDLHFGDMLRVLLRAGGEGSKFLITTRNEKTCHNLPGVIERPSLKGLGEEECWKLIQSLALPQGSINDDHEKLEIGKEIARRCYGSPMAAKALGAVLYGRSDEEWSDVLSDMRPLKDDINGAVHASLKISYHDLKYHLKKCFAYCSIFPNGYVFERDQVIRYWIAEGLIEADGNRRLESVGTKYFDELIWRSFFEKITIGTEGQNAKLFSRQVERYRMPSLMLDLAMEVSKYEFRSFESGKPLPKDNHGNSDQARYASLLQPRNTNTVKLECLEPYSKSNFRTLKFCHELNEVVGLSSSIKEPFFHKFMRLRVLDMSNSDLKLVPDSVGELIHLRFLGLSNTQITTLPENICDLFNLQTLELKGCLKLEKLPEGMHRLMNLRHLDLHLDWELIKDSTEVALPQGFDDLEQLQTLSRFYVTSANGPCNISELNKLNLRGDLCILNLEKVATGQAIYANLKGKFIDKLMLRWQSSVLNDQLLQQQSEDVIKSLEPHHGLRCLWIVNYPGNIFPEWMGDRVFRKLETIQISNCNNFNFLPLLKKLPCLKNLLIGNLPVDTMSMPGGFPSLENLKLLNLRSLRSLFLENEIPKLEQIYISNCPKLPNIKFKIENCPKLSNIIWGPEN